MVEKSHSVASGYLVAIIAAAVATVLRVSVAPDVFHAVSTMPFFVAMLISAWYGGMGPGLLATLIGTLASAWFVFPPLHSLAVAEHEDQIRLAVFVVLGAAISVGAEALHDARRRALAMRADLDERQRLTEDLRTLAAEMQEEARRKDRFLATLSHELRNPLAPMRNALQIMKIAADDPAGVADARKMMERQLAQMVRLVDDLLDVSRITRDVLELRRETVTLRSVIDAALENAAPLIEQHGHRLVVSLPPEAIRLQVDPTRIAQVFSNVLNNAAKYTDRGGEILLAAIERDGVACISVTDNGVGVPANMHSRVMDMFVQVENTRARAGGGLGIGLSLARRLVELHGGSIDLRANPSGAGTEVEVRLPALRASAGDAGRPAQDEDHPQLPRRRILVADDNVDAAGTLTMLLGLMGHETRVAHDGIEAVQVADSFRPDIVLLDIGMPAMDGHEACRRIREQEWAGSVAIVAVTGWGQDQDLERSREAGFDLHLVKPLDPETIGGVLSELVQRKTA